MVTAINNAVIHTGTEKIENKVLLIENHQVVGWQDEAPSNATLLDAAGKNLSPAFIDIQPNGGYDLYFTREVSEFALDDMYQASTDHGTGYILPTLITSEHTTIIKAIDIVKKYREKQPGVLGMHLEGPFLNVEKRGAHPANIIRQPTDEELRKIIDVGRDVIKIITIAPENFTDYQLDMLLDSGINISLGHTMINYEQAQYYFSKGIRLVTHLFNAMTQMGHRDPGLVGAVFDNEAVYAPLILDGGHCHYAAARIALKQKGDKLILLSDAAFLGRKKQRFDWENLSIQMVDGYYRDASGNLGGAAISMVDAIRNAVLHLEVTLEEAVRMATSKVARAIGLEDQLGFIRPGYDARFALFNDDLSEYEYWEL